MEEEIDLKEFFDIFWKKKIIILLVTISFICVGIYYNKCVKIPEYKSSTTLLLAQNSSSTEKEEIEEITQTDILLNNNLVSTYSLLIKSKKVVSQVLDNLSLGDVLTEDELIQNITVKAVQNTQVIEITYIDKNSDRACLIANELAKVFGQKVVEIYNINNVYIVDQAVVAQKPYNISFFKDVVIFAVMGLGISCIAIFIISLFDTTIKRAEDVEKRLGLNSLVEIPDIKVGEKKEELITHEDPKSPVSEILKTLRTNIQFTNGNSKEISILVTSTMPGEGKSWITSNLAVAFAQANKKVVIIDSDMRKGRLHNIFKTNIFPGFSNYLAEEKKSIKEYLVETQVDNLWIIPAGNVPSNPSELLSNERLVAGLEELKKKFDIILFDSTPCMLVTDAVIISRMVDTTIIVGLHKITKIENLKKVKKNIENVGGKISGVIINKVPISIKKYNSKYYYYGDRNSQKQEAEISQEQDLKEEKVNQQEKDEILEQIDIYLNKKKGK